MEVGLAWNWHRHYDASLGRYTQPDPLGLVDGPSVYGYALQNPGRYTDPTGEFVPLLLGALIGAGMEYLINPCATLQDLAFTAALGAVPGGIGQNALRKGLGMEWSHSVAARTVNLYTSGGLNRALNRRGGLNGSWVSPKRHYQHDSYRYPKGWRDFGDRYRGARKVLDRMPDWSKWLSLSPFGTLAGSGCQCEVK